MLKGVLPNGSVVDDDELSIIEGHTSTSSNERGFKRDSSPVSEIDTESGDFKGKSFAAGAVREFLLSCAQDVHGLTKAENTGHFQYTGQWA